MITLNNRHQVAFDRTLIDGVENVEAPGRFIPLPVADSSAVQLLPLIAESDTGERCSTCQQHIVAFTGSYENDSGFRLDGASMERCGCGERLTPRRTMQPDREVVTAHCLEKMVYRQESVVTVRCGNRKCQETFELLDSEYRVYCSPECRKVESKAKKAERGKELRRQRREQWKKEREEKKLVRVAQQSSPRVFAFAAAVA